jgi:hypothetical protein
VEPVTAYHQGDQIGRIFAYWACADFGQFFNAELAQKLWLPFPLEEVLYYFFFFFTGSPPRRFVLLLTKTGLSSVLGDYFHKIIWSP